MKMYDSINFSSFTNDRSYLYSIEPAATNTPLVESLSSYLSRLAEAHCVTTGTLIGKVLTPILNRRYLNNTANRGGSGLYSLGSSINGLGSTALDLVISLQELTLREDLVYSTMLPWSDVLPARGLSRAIKAWCPVCLQESREEGSVSAEQLIWTLKSVSMCTKHNIKLSTYCPNKECSKTIPVLHRRSRPGHCSNCGGWLGVSLDQVPVGNNNVMKWEIEKAKMVGELIKKSASKKCKPKRKRISTVLKYLVQELTGGTKAPFSRYIGIPDVTFRNWLSGQTIPPMESLLRICYCSNLTLVEFLTNDLSKIHYTCLREPIFNKDAGKRTKPNNRFDPIFVKKFLEDAISDDESPPPSVKEIAARLGFDRRLLYKHFPELCKTLAERRLRYIKIHSLERVKFTSQEIEKITADLLLKDIYPSRRKVEKMASRPGVIKEQAIREAWQQSLSDLNNK